MYPLFFVFWVSHYFNFAAEIEVKRNVLPFSRFIALESCGVVSFREFLRSETANIGLREFL